MINNLLNVCRKNQISMKQTSNLLAKHLRRCNTIGTTYISIKVMTKFKLYEEESIPEYV